MLLTDPATESDDRDAVMASDSLIQVLPSDEPTTESVGDDFGEGWVERTKRWQDILATDAVAHDSTHRSRERWLLLIAARRERESSLGGVDG